MKDTTEKTSLAADNPECGSGLALEEEKNVLPAEGTEKTHK